MDMTKEEFRQLVADLGDGLVPTTPRFFGNTVWDLPGRDIAQHATFGRQQARAGLRGYWKNWCAQTAKANYVTVATVKARFPFSVWAADLK